MQIVEIAALLHDYASVLNKNWYPHHHSHSAKIAGDILIKYDFPEDKIKAIQHCILCHRASKKIPSNTIEASIIASADALAHFENIDSLLYLAYVNYKMDIETGKKWVLDKLERSWTKLMPEGKKLISNDYKAIKTVFRNKST